MFIEHLHAYIESNIEQVGPMLYTYDMLPVDEQAKRNVNAICIRHMPTTADVPMYAGATATMQYQIIVRHTNQGSAMMQAYGIREGFYQINIETFNKWLVSNKAQGIKPAEAITLKVTVEPHFISREEKGSYLYSLVISAEYTEDKNLLKLDWR
ncbi:Minor capsid protein from bacteriophage [Streptococcus pneumoniae]|uniref:phage tail terminator protein n=1 Tax=Streptococcus pneumoniae TaxID=1313 RepID=UPI0005DBE1CF|nr:minor capsid protein [Streptococcus pneumoniae]HDR6318595.1 hypothetical protein [Bacillus thuringiensis]CAG7568855.1 Minor capsid protein from bacteriophage [Streptococcus pneumoniae]CEV40757.1 Minor capsid protein from bacteriophage [Streptococcus pneumoniae]CEV84687.1 Minor capsid protein from bacteriophage [Streptococcus pneumoniae]CEY70497.1 Minor capsid protein from bacteriophage [Streptococcus pneumoniae]